MNKIFVLIVLVMVLFGTVIADENSRPFFKSNGWDVATVKSGGWLLDNYPERITERFEPFRYIAHNDPQSIACFPLTIDKGVGLQWLPETEIILRYETDGEEYFAVSEYCFVIDTEEESGIRRMDNYRFTSLPGMEDRYFTTPRGRVVVFAKYKFDPMPQDAISCEVKNFNVIGSYK